MIGVFNLQSSYTMLNNTIPLPELLLTCKNNDYDFVALSDEYLYGIADLYDLTKNSKIKPIIGMKLTIIEPIETSFLIYVKNDIGYQNLLKLSYLKSTNYHFDISDLIINQAGLIIITGGYDSVLDKSLLYGNEASIEKILRDYEASFDDFYLGLSLNYKRQIDESSDKIYKLSSKLEIPVVLVHQTSYLDDSFKEAYAALIKIENDKNVIADDTTFAFLLKGQIKHIYNKYPKLATNAKDLVSSVTYAFKQPKFNMPSFDTGSDISQSEYLTTLARFGMRRRLEVNNIKNHAPYIKRLESELKVINEMNFADYFLIVYDFVKYAKQNGILVGPGRGSAAGSLVSYCLGITNVDPIKYDLMFERFLNPARTTMPDIDLDFPDNKREQVINYVKDKYGTDHICSISTYGTFALRSSIRDIARVTGVDSSRVNGIIQSVLSNKIDESDKVIMDLLAISKKIEGLQRNTSTHPAGIILAKQKLIDYIPMQTGSYSFMQSQLNGDWLEKLGLIKIDFLGLRNLTTITDILNIINKDKLIVDIHNIDLADKKTYELLSSGDTTGIFQLESSGMRNVLRKLKPKIFEDIVAVLALYRPGPMENIDTFIERRAGKKFQYLHKDLAPILKNTYGIIVYQEQIMQIAQTFAGYNLFEADMLRVGVSKKDHEILEEERTKFVSMSIANGHSNETAEVIYDYIVKFADYGFNRSHSVSYSLIAYQMAYLKANYYEVFMSTLLNHVIGNESQTRKFIDEARSKGIKIYNPDLNISTNKYISKDNKVILPLTAIKGIGKKTYELIENDRKNSNYSELIEIKQRLAKLINEVEFKALISAGALDFLKVNRSTLIRNSDLSNVEYEQYMADYKVRELKEYSYVQNMLLEKEALGFNLKFSLLYAYEKEANKKGYKPLSDASTTDNIIPVLAMIKSTREHKTKNNDTMLFLTISDDITELDVTVFPDTYKVYENYLKSGAYAFYIRSNTYNNERKYNLIKVVELHALS